MSSTFTCTALALLLLVTPQAEKGATIRIWKVGSPHTGDTPHSDVPASLAREVGQPRLAPEHRCISATGVRRPVLCRRQGRNGSGRPRLR